MTGVGGEVVAGEARYSVKNGMNRDSLEMMPQLTAPPHSWPLVETPMDDDSLNCIAVAVRLRGGEAFKFRAAIRDLERQGSAGIWEDVSDELGLPLIVGQQ